jgi:hypothetical protein
MGTGGVRLGPRLSRLGGDRTTTAAFKKGSPFLNGKKRYEKEGEVVIGSLEKGLIQAAGSAPPGLLFKGPGSGLNSSDKNEVHNSSG